MTAPPPPKRGNRVRVVWALIALAAVVAGVAVFVVTRPPVPPTVAGANLILTTEYVKTPSFPDSEHPTLSMKPNPVCWIELWTSSISHGAVADGAASFEIQENRYDNRSRERSTWQTGPNADRFTKMLQFSDMRVGDSVTQGVVTVKLLKIWTAGGGDDSPTSLFLHVTIDEPAVTCPQ